MNWLCAVVQGGYTDWSWSARFFDRISKLKAVPHVEVELETNAADLRRTLVGRRAAFAEFVAPSPSPDLNVECGMRNAESRAQSFAGSNFAS